MLPGPGMRPTRRNTAIAQDSPYRYQELANFIYGHRMRLSRGTPWSTRIERALQTLGRLVSDAEDERPTR